MSTNLKPRTVERTSLFHKQYQYSAKFSLDELGIIRGLRYRDIDRLVAERNKWRDDNSRFYGYMGRRIQDCQVEDLKTVCRLLMKHKKDIKFTVSYDTGYVYTNDLKLVEKIHKLDCIRHFQVQQVKIVGAPGTIALRNPQWTHRTYFRTKTLTEQQRVTLVEYLHGRENIRLGPGLKLWMDAKHNIGWNLWTHDYFFLDHNNDGEVLFLNMVVPRITGRTLAIVAK